MAIRWITITLPGDYQKSSYKNMYSNVLLPIIQKYSGSQNKCVTDGFTESEHAFPDLKSAKSAIKELNKILSEMIFDKKAIIKPIVGLMPLNYEKTGARNIVRPDYSIDPKYRAKSCKLPKAKIIV